MDHYSFTDPWVMDGWVGHIGWPTADGLTTKWSPVQLAVWRRIWNVRRPRHSYYTLPLIGWGIKRWCRLTSVCLSRTSDLSREQRGPARFKFSTVLAHVTRDSVTSLSSSKGQRSKSPGRFTQRGLNAWCRCSDDHEDVLGAGNYCYVASARRHVKHFVAHGGGEWRWRIVSPRAQFVAS